MTSPLVIDIPHSLGRAEAKRRIDANLPGAAKHLPGGGGTLSTRWTGEDRLEAEAHAIGQSATAIVDVGEDRVRVSLALPLMLSFMSGPIASAIRTKGAKLLAPRTA